MFSSVKPHFSSVLFITLTLLSGNMATADPIAGFGRSCETAIPAELDTVIEVSTDRFARTTFYRIEVPEAGIMIPQASSPFRKDVASDVALLGVDCRPPYAQDITYVAGPGGHSAIRMHAPGIYHARITLRENGHRDPYDLYFGFSRAVRLREGTSAHKVDEWEEDDEGLAVTPEAARLHWSRPATDKVDEWEEDDEGLTETPDIATLYWSRSAAEKVDEWEEDDEGLVDGDPAACSASTEDAGEVLVTVDEPGILTLEAAGTALFARLALLEPASKATPGMSAPMGPSADLSVWIERGSHRLRWAVAGGDVALCRPRIGFFPVR